MTGYDYGNARLRAMRAHLLDSNAIDRLLSTGSIGNMLTALTQTGYQAAVERALVQHTGIICLYRALHHDLIATFQRVHRFFSGTAGKLVTGSLRAYDVHNVKVILRGVERQQPAAEILAQTLPVGQLTDADLKALARAADARAAVDLLATWQSPLARPLLERRTAQPGAPLFALELALEQWYWDHVRVRSSQNRVWQDTLALLADITNVVTALQMVGQPNTAVHLRRLLNMQPDEWPDPESALFVAAGEITSTLLVDVARQEVMDEAIALLADTGLGPPLAAALPRYAARQQVSIFERALTQHRLRHAARLFVRDPLGIGVFLGYQALKINEVTNLRIIGNGLYLQEPPQRIREQLLLSDGAPTAVQKRSP